MQPNFIRQGTTAAMLISRSLWCNCVGTFSCLQRLSYNCYNAEIENWVVHFDLFAVLLERESEGGCPALPVCSEEVPPRRVWRGPENLPGTEGVTPSQPLQMPEENECKWPPSQSPFLAMILSQLPFLFLNHSLTRLFPRLLEWPWKPPPFCNLVVLHRALAFYSSETAKPMVWD